MIDKYDTVLKEAMYSIKLGPGTSSLEASVPRGNCIVRVFDQSPAGLFVLTVRYVGRVCIVTIVVVIVGRRCRREECRCIGV
jgi:hypothetical protein